MTISPLYSLHDAGLQARVMPAIKTRPQTRVVSQAPTPRFGGELSAETRVKPSWADRLFYDPLAQAFGYVAFHPRLFRRVRMAMNPGRLPGISEREAKQRFAPISDPIAFASVEPNVLLSGRWMPAAGAGNRAIVMGHGYTSRWTNMAPLADALRRRGYHVFLFDFRGHGRSSGSQTTFGLEEGRDIAAAVDYVRAHYPAQSERLVYYGHSMGAAALMAAPWAMAPGRPGGQEALTRLTRQLDAVILDSPYHALSDFVASQLRAMISARPRSSLLLKAWPAKALRHFARRFRLSVEDARGPWRRRLPAAVDAVRPAALMANSPALMAKPLLLIHGGADRVTEFHQGLRNYERICRHNPQAQLLALEGADHNARGWVVDASGKKRYNGMMRGGESAFSQICDFIDAQR